MLSKSSGLRVRLGDGERTLEQGEYSESKLEQHCSGLRYLQIEQSSFHTVFAFYIPIPPGVGMPRGYVIPGGRARF